MLLSPEEMDKALRASPLIVPPKSGIKAGAKFLLWSKVGGEMQLVTVTCKGEPYPVKLGNGGTAQYMDVFGWGVRKSVNIKKLRRQSTEEDT